MSVDSHRRFRHGNFMLLKSQDILVLLKLAVWRKGNWRQEDLASELGLSQSQIHSSLRRAATCGLYDYEAKRVLRSLLRNLLIHGIRYLAPARLGARGRGMPTAWGHRDVFHELAVGSSYLPVWPRPRRSGAESDNESIEVEGVEIAPLHDRVPYAAAQDKDLYEVLAAVDALRVGRPREIELAIRVLDKRLAANA